MTRWPDAASLQVERQVVGGAAQRRAGRRARECAPGNLARRTWAMGVRPTERPADHPVVVEHRHAVGGDPHVALQPVRAQLERQREGLDACSPGRMPCAPRWAKAIGSSSSDGRRCCTAAMMPRRRRGSRQRAEVHCCNRRSPPRLADVFNIQGSELIFLLLIALVVLGPEKLPDAVRKFAKAYAEFKKMANGFQGELRQALDEPMRELRDTADAMRAAANFDLDGDGAAPATSTRAASETATAAPVRASRA